MDQCHISVLSPSVCGGSISFDLHLQRCLQPLPLGFHRVSAVWVPKPSGPECYSCSVASAPLEWEGETECAGAREVPATSRE